MVQTLLMIVMVVMAIFLILLVLVQRGRGGGLAVLSAAWVVKSAFGTKAGDLFTKITIVTAIFWILLLIAADRYFASTSGESFDSSLGGAAAATQTVPGTGAPAQGADAAATGTPAAEAPATSTTPAASTPPATTPAAPAKDAKTEPSK